MKVLLVCSGGMSSAIVVKAVKKEAELQSFSLDIKAVGTGEFEDELREGNYNLVIVAPQVKHRLKNFIAQAEAFNVLVEMIVPMGYTPLGASKVLDQIRKHVK